jgi:hypothetical protein
MMRKLLKDKPDLDKSPESSLDMFLSKETALALMSNGPDYLHLSKNAEQTVPPVAFGHPSSVEIHRPAVPSDKSRYSSLPKPKKMLKTFKRYFGLNKDKKSPSDVDQASQLDHDASDGFSQLDGSDMAPSSSASQPLPTQKLNISADNVRVDYYLELIFLFVVDTTLS